MVLRQKFTRDGIRAKEYQVKPIECFKVEPSTLLADRPTSHASPSSESDSDHGEIDDHVTTPPEITEPPRAADAAATNDNGLRRSARERKPPGYLKDYILY